MINIPLNSLNILNSIIVKLKAKFHKYSFLMIIDYVLL